MLSVHRYDGLLNHFYTPDQVVGPIRAMVLQISVDRIAASVVAFQRASAHTFLREPRSFGFWSPRRCDVYIVSYTPGYLNDRLEVAALLWKNGISADVMYEAAITQVGQEDHLDVCDAEGIL
jgi:eukaryotic translation initiation factor 2-alpha kinase 4